MRVLACPPDLSWVSFFSFSFLFFFLFFFPFAFSFGLANPVGFCFFSTFSTLLPRVTVRFDNIFRPLWLLP